MKLSDFNTEDLKRMQQAIKDTRAKYDGYRDHQVPKWMNMCHLCKFALSLQDGHDYACPFCPWEIIEGIDCEEANHSDQKTFTRRNRLDRWYNLIEEEIRRREG
jgi:hypothetical protein